MSAEIAALIEKGRRSLDAARRLLESGDHDFGVSRAYYAMFYLASAMLRSRNRTPSKHSAVIAAFAQQFVATGEFLGAHHAALREAFDLRLIGDYSPVSHVTSEQARRVLENATRFVNDAEAWLRRTGG